MLKSEMVLVNRGSPPECDGDDPPVSFRFNSHTRLDRPIRGDIEPKPALKRIPDHLIVPLPCQANRIRWAATDG